MKLYLVRHGQSTGNIGGTLMGQSDHPLTPLGEDQARAAAERLAPFGPMPVYSSDLPRARATAEHIAAAWQAADVADAPAGDPRRAPARDLAGRLRRAAPGRSSRPTPALTAAFAADPYRTTAA